jgi:hypothetical protein
MVDQSVLKFGKSVSDFYSDETLFRQSIFDGMIFILEPNDHTLSVCETIQHLIASLMEIQTDELFSLEKIHENYSFEEIFSCLNAVKKRIASKLFTQDCLPRILPSLGLNQTRYKYDVMRLRWNQPLAEFNPWASYAVMHRDTWYANLQSQLNFWIPLTDVQAGQGFKIYPEFFNTPIENTSHTFDFANWRNQGGFQSDREGGEQVYPTVKRLPDSKHAINIECVKGSVVIFSAAHLHQTSHNQTEDSRLSVDFRIVYPLDVKNRRSAHNVDNASKGDASVDYYCFDSA